MSMLFSFGSLDSMIVSFTWTCSWGIKNHKEKFVWY